MPFACPVPRASPLPLPPAELAQIDRTAMAVGGAAEQHLACHTVGIHRDFETIGDRAALMPRFELHHDVVVCQPANHAASELLGFLAAGQLTALLPQAQSVQALAVQKLHMEG